MNIKILSSILVVGLAAAGTTYGTFAFFSDTETSTENLFTAGGLDLTLDGLNGVTATIGGPNLAPGDVQSGSVLLRNEGTILNGDAQGHLVDLDFMVTLGYTDDPGNADDADDGGYSIVHTPRHYEVTALAYDGGSLLPLGDVDGDGWANTLSDLEAHGPFVDVADPGAAGKPFAITVAFRTDAGNEHKRDVVDLTLTFHLAQGMAPDLEGTLVYQTFGSPAPTATGTWSSEATELTPNQMDAFLGRYSAETVTLDVTGLPAHEEITIAFDLFIIASWDGNSLQWGPDEFRFLVDGATQIDTTFSNLDYNPHTQCWPQDCPADNPGMTGAFAKNALGFSWSGTPMDTVYKIVVTVPHTANTVQFSFVGAMDEWLSNEAWGLDNVRVTVA